MQIATQWQTAYYTPAPYMHTERKKRVYRCETGVTKRIVLDYLEKHGMTEKRVLLKNLGMSQCRLNHGLHNLGSLVDYEQSGAGSNRMCHYWAVSNPPRVEQRCASYRAWDYISRNPWCLASDIPAEIIPTPRHRHMCVMTLETAGRLVSKVENKRKLYMAVA